MDDLTAWLRAQLDEDERIANAAPRYNWTIYLAGDPETGEETERRVLDHVIRHDPARVLREVEAKRRIMDLHRPARKRSTSGIGEDIIEDCQMCDHFPAQYPCATIRLLALPYSDRPGYREEWRP